MMGLIHATNRLYRYDPDAWQEIYTLLPEGVLRDLAANSRYWKKYETPVGETADRWNDAYLKANDQTDGVQSLRPYGRSAHRFLQGAGIDLSSIFAGSCKPREADPVGWPFLQVKAMLNFIFGLTNAVGRPILADIFFTQRSAEQ